MQTLANLTEAEQGVKPLRPIEGMPPTDLAPHGVVPLVIASKLGQAARGLYQLVQPPEIP